MLFEIGQQIKQARKQGKMSQDDLATMLRMSRTTIGQIENGTVQEIGVRKLIRILETLGLELRLRPTADSRCAPRRRGMPMNDTGRLVR